MMRSTNALTPLTYEVLRYWMRDQADHGVFVKSDLSADNLRDADKALQYARRFQAIEDAAIEKSKNVDLISREARSLVVEAVGFQNRLLRDQLDGRLLAKGYPTFRDHLVKESQYFLRMLGPVPPGRSGTRDILYETLFWLRQMFEHALFIVHWADPYDLLLKKSATEYMEKFEGLLNKARLFVSMASPEPVPEIPSPGGTDLGPVPPLALQAEPPKAIVRLAEQSLSLTADYRDYLAGLKPAVEETRVLGIITPLFMDHQTRESDYFIADLKMILTGDEGAFREEYAKMPFKKDAAEEKLYRGRQDMGPIPL